MAIRNKPDLTTQEREAIRRLKAKKPTMSLEAIGDVFNVSASCVWGVLNRKFAGEAEAPSPVRMQLPPEAVVKQPESIIRPINPALLRAGRASVARSYRAA